MLVQANNNFGITTNDFKGISKGGNKEEPNTDLRWVFWSWKKRWELLKGKI